MLQIKARFVDNEQVGAHAPTSQSVQSSATCTEWNAVDLIERVGLSNIH